MDETPLIAIANDHMYESLFKNQRLCVICRQLLPLEGNMLIHIRIHGDEEKHKLKVDKILRRYPAIERAKFMCNYCSKTFATKDRLTQHERLHGNGGKPYECFYCDRRFAATKYLSGHEVTHAPCPTSSECPDCGVSFSQESALLEHVTKGTCKGENFGCCDNIFTRRIDFLKHQQDFHGGKKIKCHACSICGKNFSLPCTLKIHVKNHQEPPRRRRRRTVKKNEDGTEVPRAKPTQFVCRVCKMPFSDRRLLYKHSQGHEGDKPFVCQICSKSYTQKTNLQLHMRTHTGEPSAPKLLNKQWHCNYCEKTFGSGQACTAHERIHTGEKPFQCQYCDRRFSRAWTLTTHLATHTGERRYGCEECGKRFAQRSTLQSHLKTHEKDYVPRKKPHKSKPKKSRKKEETSDSDSDSEEHFDLLYAAMGMKSTYARVK